MPATTSVFSEAALAYLQGERRLARIATVGPDGTPHVVPVDPWRPRAIEVRGRAEALHEPQPLIRIHPERIVSWGIEPEPEAAP